MLLKELGGRATTKEVKELARRRYPDATLWHYVFQRLRQLEAWGIVRNLGSDTWTIEAELGD